MAKIRLVPSEIYNGASSYVTITDAANAYHNTDNNTYATAQNTNASTNNRYIYLRGFNFDAIPSGVTINSFTIKVKGRESGVSTSASYAPSLTSGTSAISNTTASENFGTSVKTITVPTGALTWQQVLNSGSTFSIRLNVRRASRNTVGYLYIYGAEIEVDYTPLSDPRTITTTLTGDGTISPSGQTTMYDGQTYELTITPTNKSDPVTATKNGVDITNQLVPHYTDTSKQRVLGSYSLVSGGFNGQGASYFSGLVGKGADASQTTSNYYSSGNGTIAVFEYDMSFTDIPSNATITRVWCEVNGHAESTSQSAEYMCAQLRSGNTDLSAELNFKDVSTSNSTQTIEATTLPTIAQLQNMVLRCRLGYYGGAINGATCYVEYEIGSGQVEYYTYTYEVDGDATIAVVIGSQGDKYIYAKENGTWVRYTKAYKKVNGSWVLQSDLTTVFNNSTNYIRGN